MLKNFCGAVALATMVAGCGEMPASQAALVAPAVPAADAAVACADNECSIDGQCWVWEARNPENECEVCHVKFSRNRWFVLDACR